MHIFLNRTQELTPTTDRQTTLISEVARGINKQLKKHINTEHELLLVTSELVRIVQDLHKQHERNKCHQLHNVMFIGSPWYLRLSEHWYFQAA